MNKQHLLLICILGTHLHTLYAEETKSPLQQQLIRDYQTRLSNAVRPWYPFSSPNTSDWHAIIKHPHVAYQQKDTLFSLLDQLHTQQKGEEIEVFLSQLRDTIVSFLTKQATIEPEKRIETLDLLDTLFTLPIFYAKTLSSQQQQEMQLTLAKLLISLVHFAQLKRTPRSTESIQLHISNAKKKLFKLCRQEPILQEKITHFLTLFNHSLLSTPGAFTARRTRMTVATLALLSVIALAIWKRKQLSHAWQSWRNLSLMQTIITKLTPIAARLGTAFGAGWVRGRAAGTP